MQTIRVGTLVCCALLMPQLALSQDADKPRDIETLVRQLDSNDPVAQEDALDDLRYVGVAALPAVPALTKIVGSAHDDRRETALEILGGIGPQAAAAVPAIANVLKEPGVAPRIAAAEALLRIVPNHAGAVAVLGNILRAENADHRRFAAQTIVHLGRIAGQCESALMEAAGDKDSSVRFLIAEALGLIGLDRSERTLPTLKAMLADDDAAVRVAAADSMWTLEQPAETVLPTLLQVLKDYKPGREVRPELQLLQERLPTASAASVLGRLGPEARSAVPALIEASERPNMGLRLAAIDALGDIGSDASAAIDRLAKALRETEVHAVPLVHQSWCISDQAAIALRKIGPASRDVLIAALKDKDERVQYNALRALATTSPLPRSRTCLMIRTWRFAARRPIRWESWGDPRPALRPSWRRY
jgi:HEAT repeat protein